MNCTMMFLNTKVIRMTTLGASCFNSKGTTTVYGLHINVYMYYSNVKHIPNYANLYEEEVNN
jgi:hypothetical protein